MTGLSGLFAITLTTIYFISIFWAFNTAEAFFSAERILLLITSFLIAHTFFIQNPKFGNTLSALITIISIIYSGYAIFQYISLKNFDIQSLYGVRSFSGHKNLLSCFLFLSLPFTLKTFKNFSGVLRLLGIIAFGLLLVLIVLLQTRSVWLATIISSSFFIGLYFVKNRHNLSSTSLLKQPALIISTITVVSMGILYFTDSSFTKQLAARADITQYVGSRTGSERLEIWKNTWKMIEDAFPLGVGAGNWQFYFPKYSVDRVESAATDLQTFQRPHNDFLWVWAETGPLGILLYLAFLLFPLYYSVRAYIKEGEIENAWFVSSVIGFMIISFFDFPLERIETTVLLALTLALLSLNERNSFTRKHIQNRLPIYAISFLLTINLITGFYRVRGEYNMGRVYSTRKTQSWPQVTRYANQAKSFFYSVDPTTIPTSWYTGLAYFNSGAYKEAYKAYNQALTISPYNHYLLNDMGSAAETLGKHEEAKRYYLKALQINSRFDDPKLNLAAIYFNEGKFEAALEWASKASTDNPKRMYFIKTIKANMN